MKPVIGMKLGAAYGKAAADHLQIPGEAALPLAEIAYTQPIARSLIGSLTTYLSNKPAGISQKERSEMLKRMVF